MEDIVLNPKQVISHTSANREQEGVPVL